jgi:hypothetical protein
LPESSPGEEEVITGIGAPLFILGAQFGHQGLQVA